MFQFQMRSATNCSAITVSLENSKNRAVGQDDYYVICNT